MWYSNLLRVEILEHIYDDIPELIGVFVKTIKIDNDENKLSVLFEMPSLPKKMPLKWEKSNCNMVLCQLDFWDIEFCTFQLNSMFGKSDIVIEYDELFKVKIKGNFDVNFKAEYGMVQKINAYQISDSI